MTRISQRAITKPMRSAILAVAAIWVVGCLAWVVHRQGLLPREGAAGDRVRADSNTMPTISLQDIAQLPAHATYEDVARLLKGWMFADNLMYRCPAREGGVYFFSFLPTHEVALPSENGKPEELVLAAVVRLPSDEALLKGDYSDGTYVYPARLAGVSFSGFSWSHPTTEGVTGSEAALRPTGGRGP